ncbi:MAG: adenosine kinase [Bacteroidetes bacterium]|nr:adenosine kinase [Bacteroidota bacterium]
MKKVLGIGNALVDIMTILKDDVFLEEQNLPKGSMQPVNADVSAKVLAATGGLEKSQSSGGSAANTIHGLSNLGIQTGYIGKIGRDEFGSFFRNDMEKSNIHAILLESETPTGRAIAMISPDTERTFATFLGAAVELSAGDLLTEHFTGYSYLHLEGYLAFNEELILRAAKLAKEAGLKVALDLASYNVVSIKHDFLKMLVSEYVDIVFANEEEAKAFTGMEPEPALHELAKLCETAVVKIGAKGSVIKYDEEVYYVDPVSVIPVDTTGAGDLYASGFLYGLLQHEPLDKCGRIGSLLAGKVIEVVGSKMSKPAWTEINRAIVTI